METLIAPGGLRVQEIRTVDSECGGGGPGSSAPPELPCLLFVMARFLGDAPPTTHLRLDVAV
jgi:hypothetical protein